MAIGTSEARASIAASRGSTSARQDDGNLHEQP